MTSQKIAIGLVAVALFVGGVTAHAADFGAGVKAYESGDYATALRIMRELADQGEAKAQFNLGIMYLIGQGVALDFAEAVRWYHKAANQGHARSQGELGFMYEHGFGVPQDYVQAHMWYNIAAAQGKKLTAAHMSLPGPREFRDRLAKQMTPAQIAEAQRLAREWNPKGK